MKADEFLLYLKQGRTVEIDGEIFFTEKINGSVNMVYSRPREKLSDVKPRGYVVRGRDYYVSFSGEDSMYTIPDLEVRSYRKVERHVISLTRGFITDAINERIDKENIFGRESLDSKVHAALSFNSDRGLVTCSRGVGGITASGIHKSAFDLDFKIHVMEYIDKGFDYLKEMANDIAQRIPEVDLRNDASDFVILHDIYFAPKEHINEWCGKIMKSLVVDDDTCYKVEYRDWRTELDCEVELTWNAHANIVGGYLEGADRKNDYHYIPFSRVNRIFENGVCIFDGESEKERITAPEFQKAIEDMIRLLNEKGGIWNVEERIKAATDGNLVYNETIGRFGIVDGGIVFFDSGKQEHLDEECFVFSDLELGSGLLAMKDSLHKSAFRESSAGRCR